MNQPALNLSSTRNKHAKTPAKEPPKAARLPVDWAAKHGPVTGTLSATTGCAATALLGAATSMPEGWPLAIGAAGALGHGIGASVARRLTGRSITTRIASWLLAGGWTTWSMTTGPLTWTAAGTLAALGVGIGAMASNAAAHEEAAEEERLSAEAKALAREMNAEREAIAREWEERICRVCRVQVKVFAVQLWQTGAGFSLALELPGGGATWDHIAQKAKALAGDAGLPLGCAIGVEEGDRQGRVVIDIPTENVMAADYPYPGDYSPLSILTGIPWGLLPHSDPVTVFLREACALILGPPGSGKSTFLDAVLAGFARCTDVLPWVIDLKGGAVGIPWVTPWLEAEGKLTPDEGSAPPPAGTRPGIDWLASTPMEAVRMMRVVIAVNEARQRGYQRLMRRHNTTLLPVSSEIPQIEVVIDEGAEVLSGNFGNPVMRELQKLVKKAMRTTRAMGIRLVLTAVDGNVSAIGDTEVRKFSPVGAALTSAESSGNNAEKLFGRVRIDASQLTAKGAGIIGAATAEGFAPTAFKGWKTSPGMVREAVLATSARHPVLDQVSATAAGTDYSERWNTERAGWLWENDHPPTNTEGETPNTRPKTTGSPPGGLNLSYKRHDQPGGQEDADALAERFRKQLDETFGHADEPRRNTPADRQGLNLSYQHTQEPSGTEQAEGPGPRSAAGPDWLPRAIDAIEAAGARGMKPAAVADLVGRSRYTVRAALQAAAERGELVYRDNGPHSVYVHPDHTEQ